MTEEAVQEARTQAKTMCIQWIKKLNKNEFPARHFELHFFKYKNKCQEALGLATTDIEEKSINKNDFILYCEVFSLHTIGRGP